MRAFARTWPELCAEVGDGLTGRRRRIVGVFEPPLLQQRSDTPCPMLTSSSCFSQGRSATRSPEVLRNGARALLAQAIEAEVAEFLAKHVDLKTATGLRRVVRHVHLPEREVMTGIGPVGVRQPRVRDRGAADDTGRIRFTPAILPPSALRSRSLEVLIPILYLKGISTGDFEEALAALLGKDAPGLPRPSRGSRRSGST